jgi:hypothetical protein
VEWNQNIDARFRPGRSVNDRRGVAAVPVPVIGIIAVVVSIIASSLVAVIAVAVIAMHLAATVMRVVFVCPSRLCGETAESAQGRGNGYRDAPTAFNDGHVVLSL